MTQFFNRPTILLLTSRFSRVSDLWLVARIGKRVRADVPHGGTASLQFKFCSTRDELC